MIDKILTQNALFSFINGLAMAAFSGALANLLFTNPETPIGLSAIQILYILAAILVPFALIILAHVRKLFAFKPMLLLITIADISWIIGVLLVIMFTDVLSNIGLIYFAFTSVVVGYFARYQMLELRKTTSD